MVAGGDADLEREVFAEFLRVNREDVAALQRAFEGRDLALVTQAAHRIKGATKTIGALDLAQVCSRIEMAARANDWATIAAHQDAFQREAERLNAYLEALVRGAETSDQAP